MKELSNKSNVSFPRPLSRVLTLAGIKLQNVGWKFGHFSTLPPVTIVLILPIYLLPKNAISLVLPLAYCHN